MEKRSFIFVCVLTLSFFLINNYFFQSPPLVKPTELSLQKEPVELAPVAVSHPETSTSKETFYLLENPYQQLVFSTQGGALAEINLPLASKTNHDSIVHPIEFDTLIEEQSPENAEFPLNPYITIENGTSVKKSPVKGGYTPLLRRPLKNANGSFSPNYYALNLLSDKGSVPYRMTKMGKDFIEFTGKDEGRSITKLYKIPKETPYTVELHTTVTGDPKGLSITSGLLEVELVSGSYSPLLQYYTQTKKKESVETIKLPKGDMKYPALMPIWSASSNGFFGMILDPTNDASHGIHVRSIPGETAPSRLTLIESAYDLYPAKDYPAYQFLLPYKPTNETTTFVLFAGPYSSDVLKTVDAALANPVTGIGGDPHFSKAVVLQGFFTFISEPFAKFLFFVMQFFYFLTHSWGISIILLTFVLRLILYPLNTWSYKSMSKAQKIGPKLEEIKEKFKKDPKRLQQETMMLYKTEGVNPLSGCLPLIIQLPFLIGMFDLLKSTFALRGASFIPGWINNLTAPDVLFSWHYPILFFGTDFHLLPLLLGGLTYFQQRMGLMQQAKKGPLTEQQQQMKMMGNIMTIFFVFMFYNMPSGLNIYWIFSTLFGILQQWLITRRFQKNPKLLKD